VESLTPPTSGESHFATEVIDDATGTRLGLSAKSLALMLPVLEDSEHDGDVRYANLVVRQRASCRVVESGVESSGTFAVVECVSPDHQVRDTFLDVVEWLVPEGPLNAGEVRSIIASLVRLFQLSEAPPRTSTVGLWGELWLMSISSDAAAMARAWHVTMRDRWDFSAEGLRLEVKTSTGVRRHHFSLEQLTAPADAVIRVASIVTTRLASGPSIRTLLEQVLTDIDDADLRGQVVNVAMSSLGDGWSTGRLEAFDADLARTTLRILDADLIPSVEQPPPEVSAVSFEVDVEDVDPVDASDPAEPCLVRSLR
jgi:hypothetical protein